MNIYNFDWINRVTSDDFALVPEDLSRLFIKRLNDGDIDGLLTLYETSAILSLNPETTARGTEGIRESLERIIYDIVVRNILFESDPAPTLRQNDLSLISRRFRVNYVRKGDQTTIRAGMINEVARQQTDGTWLLVITQILFDTPL